MDEKPTTDAKPLRSSLADNKRRQRAYLSIIRTAHHFPYIHKLAEQLISSILDTDTPIKPINSSRIPQSSSNQVLSPTRHQETIFPLFIYPLSINREIFPSRRMIYYHSLNSVSRTLINDPMDRFFHEFFPILYSR